MRFQKIGMRLKIVRAVVNQALVSDAGIAKVTLHRITDIKPQKVLSNFVKISCCFVRGQ